MGMSENAWAFTDEEESTRKRIKTRISEKINLLKYF